jgi:hypothetical protein
VKCLTCDGAGALEHYVDQSDYVPCPVCEGSGEVDDPPSTLDTPEMMAENLIAEFWSRESKAILKIEITRALREYAAAARDAALEEAATIAENKYAGCTRDWRERTHAGTDIAHHIRGLKTKKV